MRGKPLEEVAKYGAAGITPADAGKTKGNAQPSRERTDHPRGCGENRSGGVELGKERGSPPRMRGKLVGSVFNDGVYRITPADAGKTCEFKVNFVRRQDHPRGCGENSYAVMRFSSILGSPPRMRGKLCACPCSLRSGRITPADAGKTLSAYRHTRRNGDHPRGCGENRLSHINSNTNPGSPPRMRGKLAERIIARPLHGITPADAGKTPSDSRLKTS